MLPSWAKYLCMVTAERDTLTAGKPKSSSLKRRHLPNDYLFCGTEAIIDRKHPERERERGGGERDVIMSVRTLSIRKTISLFRKTAANPLFEANPSFDLSHYR